MKETMSTREAARLFDVSESTIRRWVRAGTLPAYKNGRAYCIDAHGAQALHEEYQAQPRVSPQTQVPEGCLSTADVARMAHVDESTVILWIHDGKLPARRERWAWAIRPKDARRWLRKRRPPGETGPDLTCTVCGRKGVRARNRCRTCYEFRLTYGYDRDPTRPRRRGHRPKPCTITGGCFNCGNPSVHRDGRCYSCWIFRLEHGHEKNVAFVRTQQSWGGVRKWDCIEDQIQATLRGDIKPLEVPPGVRSLSELDDFDG